jgi:hypothetical protein
MEQARLGCLAGVRRQMDRSMAAECDQKGSQKLTWEGGRGREKKLIAWVPCPPVAGVESLGKHICLCALLLEESRLPETISIFIFLGNFAAFISGKIKAVIAGEMIPIRA